MIVYFFTAALDLDLASYKIPKVFTWLDLFLGLLES